MSLLEGNSLAFEQVLSRLDQSVWAVMSFRRDLCNDVALCGTGTVPDDADQAKKKNENERESRGRLVSDGRDWRRPGSI